MQRMKSDMLSKKAGIIVRGCRKISDASDKTAELSENSEKVIHNN